MGIDSAPRQRDTKNEEWKSIEHDIDAALRALQTPPKDLGKVAQIDWGLASRPVLHISLRPIEEVEEYMMANDAVLSQEQKNFLLAHLRAKRFKKDNHIE
ncbi:MAG TPA: hypothetical protein VMU13_03380 [Candidatus Paceibacterota bacterium]|nr:hypothetical protein [Candidatus Paceibacterota bacterium]